MSEFFSKDVITKILLGLVIAAVGFLFNFVFDMRHTIIVVAEQRDADKVQWKRISRNTVDIAIIKENLKWLIKLKH